MARQQLLGLFLVLAIMVAVVWGDPSGGCDQDRQDMIRECKKYEGWPAEPKIEPSEACCAVWQRANIPCLCAGVTKEKEKVWCMEKVVYVAKFCKKPFQPGYQCGSKWNRSVDFILLFLLVYMYMYWTICLILLLYGFAGYTVPSSLGQ